MALLAAGTVAVLACTLVTAPLARMTSRLPVTARPASGVRLPGVPRVLDLDPGAVARAVAGLVRLAAIVL